MRPRVPLRILVLGTALAGLTAAAVLAGGHTAEPGPPETAALLRARSSALRNRMDLARDGRFFLVLEPDRGGLTLYHGGAPLRRYTVLAVAAGLRRLDVGRGQAREDWRTARWEEPRLEPPVHRDRRVIVSDSVVPPDRTGAVDWIPPTPEEAVPTPPRFTVHYAGGLGLEVVAAGADTAGVRAGVLARVEHRVRRLLPRNWDRYRIRVVMPAAEAGALYRSFPEGTSLVAVIPDP